MASYDEWLNAKLSRESPFGKCAEWTEEAAGRFPHLTRVRGQVLLSNGWLRDHWWLTDSGAILDPTASQFEQEYFFGCSRIVEYLPRDESEPEPIGRCANCGEYCYPGAPCDMLCSDACERAYHTYVMSGL